MTLSTDQCLAAIEAHSRSLATAAEGHLSAPVEHCPGWSVADLVHHVTEVHWFWGTIAAEHLDAPVDSTRRLPRAADDQLVETFRTGAAQLVDILRDADQEAPVWTWFPGRQDIGFITRHQVQEAAVHHWDAAHASGRPITIGPEVAADSVEEFLTCSLAEAEDVARIGTVLPGPLTLAATDTGQAWTVSQQTPTAPLLWTVGTADPATVSGTAADLLLWLYQRVELPSTDPDLVTAFRSLSSSD